MKQIHYLQLQILKKLLFSESLHFSELKPEAIENNQFNFHLKTLVKDGLIIKEENSYKLSTKGKEYANRMDTDKTQIQRQAKISIIPVCLRSIERKDFEVLIFTRLKQPFYGHQGFPSGKVAWGEKIIDASIRELKEETALKGTPELFRIKHYHVYDKVTKELLEDKIFFFTRIIDPQGTLVPSNEGLYEWIKFSDLRSYLTKPFDTVESELEIIKQAKEFDGNIVFQEKDHYTDSF